MQPLRGSPQLSHHARREGLHQWPGLRLVPTCSLCGTGAEGQRTAVLQTLADSNNGPKQQPLHPVSLVLPTFNEQCERAHIRG